MKNFQRIKRWFKTLNFNNLLFIAIFAVMLMPITLTLIKQISPGAYQRLLKFNAAALSETPKVDATWTWKGMKKGEWQTNFENELSATIPFRATIVRLHNQFYYSLFSKSYMVSEQLLIGRHKFLFSQFYLEKYCNLKRREFSQIAFKKWAAELKAIENYFSSQGKLFVYLITPSKAAYYPEHIPKSYPCSVEKKRPDYQLAINSLREAGVTFVDGSAITLANKAQYGQLMFPKGGIHWSSLGATFTLEALLKTLQKSNQRLPLPNYIFNIDNVPQGSDRDLLSLANLYSPQDYYLVPHLTFSPANTQPHKIALIGGSFLDLIVSALYQSEIFSSIDYFFYLDTWHAQYKPQKPHEILKNNLDLSDSSHFAAIFNSDIVILEENESMLFSPHINRLVTMLNKTQHAQLSYSIYG